MTEQKYLAMQERQARQAMAEAVKRLSHHVKFGADPLEWTREYPWLAMGAAAVTGAVVAGTVIPSRRPRKPSFIFRRLIRLAPAKKNGEKESAPAEFAAKIHEKLVAFLMAEGVSLGGRLVSALLEKYRQNHSNGASHPASPDHPSLNSSQTSA